MTSGLVQFVPVFRGPALQFAAGQKPLVVAPVVKVSPFVFGRKIAPVRVLGIDSAFRIPGLSATTRPALARFATPAVPRRFLRHGSPLPFSPFVYSGLGFATIPLPTAGTQSSVTHDAGTISPSNPVTTTVHTTGRTQSSNPGTDNQVDSRVSPSAEVLTRASFAPSTAQATLQSQAQQDESTTNASGLGSAPSSAAVRVPQTQITDPVPVLSRADSAPLPEAFFASSSADFATTPRFPQDDDFAGSPVFGFYQGAIADPVAIFSNPGADFAGVLSSAGTMPGSSASPVVLPNTQGRTNSSAIPLPASFKPALRVAPSSASANSTGKALVELPPSASSDLSAPAAKMATQTPLTLDLRAAPAFARQVHSEAEPESLYRVNATSGASTDSDGSPEGGDQNHPDPQ